MIFGMKGQSRNFKLGSYNLLLFIILFSPSKGDSFFGDTPQYPLVVWPGYQLVSLILMIIIYSY